jgi:uncharacterized membrane protein
MTKNRLEAFSDGVIAIIITIMVLEFRPPKTFDLAALLSLLPTFVSYVLSFMYVGIYWGNHHHLLHGVKRVSAGIIWANMNLLFWLSLIPFATAWTSGSNFASLPVVVYAVMLFLCGFSYDILRRAIDACHPEPGKLRAVLEKQRYKGYVSLAAYSLSILAAFFNVWVAEFLFFVVAIMWIIPDKNIEKALSED